MAIFEKLNGFEAMTTRDGFATLCGPVSLASIITISKLDQGCLLYV